VNVAPAGSPVAVSKVMASPSGSITWTFTVASCPTKQATVSGTITTGGRSTPLMVIWVVAEPMSALLAVKLTV
jgi:hypothetical protein